MQTRVEVFEARLFTSFLTRLAAENKKLVRLFGAAPPLIP